MTKNIERTQTTKLQVNRSSQATFITHGTNKAVQLRHFSHGNIKLTTKIRQGYRTVKRLAEKEQDLFIRLTHVQEICVNFVHQLLTQVQTRVEKAVFYSMQETCVRKKNLHNKACQTYRFLLQVDLYMFLSVS